MRSPCLLAFLALSLVGCDSPAPPTPPTVKVPAAPPLEPQPDPEVEPAPGSPYPARAVPRLEGVTRPGLPPVTGRIHVDQFGYLPAAAKVAVLSDPKRGYNAGDEYAPPAELEVRAVESGETVLRGAPVAWRDGAIHAESGDRGWWFDFSALAAPGSYYVFDPEAGLRSPVFRIANDVYRPVLIAAVRTYFYQRLGMPLQPPHAEAPWTFDAEMNQDRHARYVHAKEDASTERDLSGGWMDAGDTNKYPTFNNEVIHPLLYAYRANSSVFTDDFNIPESGNGLPDLLDEVKYQLDWLLRMQDPDGGVLLKLGTVQHISIWPIAKEPSPRFYLGKCSGSTISFAGYIAHAARVYGEFAPWSEYAADLKARAVRAWDWYEANPKTEKLDTGEVKAGIANRSIAEQERLEAVAAFHLWRLTGEERFHERFKQRAPQTRQLSEWVWSVYESASTEALVEYTGLPEAEPALAKRIRGHLLASAKNQKWAPSPDADLYRFWIEPSAYHWGSNTVRAAYGRVARMAATLPETPPSLRAQLDERALSMLHGLHGVNPQTMVFLTNMQSLGAELSAMRLYHHRFGARSPHSDNPPPGYVVGGPNASNTAADKPEAPGVIAWLRHQPKAKAYADYNDGWPLNSWEITENGIYYQASYIRLLADFVRP
jgi:hypothetical protein